MCVTAQRIDMFFHRAIDSVLHQRRPPDEVIVVIDNLSEDLEDSRWFKELPESWTKIWTEQTDSGPSYVKNLAMHYGTGDWLLLLSGDDFITPTCIERYEKYLKDTTANIVTEYCYAELTHYNLQVIKKLPCDKNQWAAVSKNLSKHVLTGLWRKGVLPLRTVFVRNEGKKYFPLDFKCVEDSVFILYHLLEERRVALSDIISYIPNNHPHAIFYRYVGTLFGSNPDELRFKCAAGNIQINGWTLKEKIFEQFLSSTFLDNYDIDYIEQTISYFTFI